MSLASYDDLKSAVASWLKRSDLSGSAADFITLAEAGLNRELNAVETDQALTGVVGSREIDVSAYSVVEPLALFLFQTGNDELELTKKQAGTFEYRDETDEPEIWTLDGTKIKFDSKLDEAYTFRFRLRQRFALSESATTNWLLTNHPDVYLAATLVWGGVFAMNDPKAATFAGILKTGIPSVRNIIAQQNRGVLTVDPALASIGRWWTFNYATGE